MLKKFSVVVMSIIVATALFACGGTKQNNQVDPQVAELQKQIADLQQQVNQQNQQGQNTQSAQTNQQSQQVQQTQANLGQQNNQAQNNNQSNQIQNNVQGIQGNGQGNFAGGFGNQTANISMDRAKEIATQNAGFDVNSVTFIKTMQDYDDYYLKWEIDFVANNAKYEYDISATDGSILKAEREGIAYQGNVAQGNVGGQQAMQGNVGGQQVGGNFGGGIQGNGQGIDVEQAKSIAVQHAGFNVSNVTFIKQKYDFDDGIAKWEIEFVVNTNKYEYEVNAANGAIVKYQVESVYDD